MSDRWDFLRKSEAVKVIEAESEARQAEIRVESRAEQDRIRAEARATRDGAQLNSVLLESSKNAAAWRDACFGDRSHDTGDWSVGEYGDGGEPGNYIYTGTDGYA